MCALTNYGDMVRTSIRERVDVIISGAGLPLDLPGYLREVSEDAKEDMRTKLIPIVSSGRAAGILCRKWMNKFSYLPDGFVVEGPKAGGHLGFKAEQIDDPAYQLENIVTDVIGAVTPYREKHNKDIPVIAAGGVTLAKISPNSWNSAHQESRWAPASWLPRNAMPTKPSSAPISTRKKEDLTIIKSPVGMPGRALKNNFLDAVSTGLKHPKKCVHKCLHSCAEEDSPYCIAQALVNAYRGKLKHGFAFAGANAYLVDKIVTVKDVMNSLKDDFEKYRRETLTK